MRERTWQLRQAKPSPRPKLAADVRGRIDAQLPLVVARLKRRLCQKPRQPRFNWPADIIARWHRDALYFVVVMRTPHGRPATFETHHARMEHVGKGKFHLAVPIRKGWSTILHAASPEECLQALGDPAS